MCVRSRAVTRAMRGEAGRRGRRAARAACLVRLENKTHDGTHIRGRGGVLKLFWQARFQLFVLWEQGCVSSVRNSVLRRRLEHLSYAPMHQCSQSTIVRKHTYTYTARERERGVVIATLGKAYGTAILMSFLIPGAAPVPNQAGCRLAAQCLILRFCSLLQRQRCVWALRSTSGLVCIATCRCVLWCGYPCGWLCGGSTGGWWWRW